MKQRLSDVLGRGGRELETEECRQPLEKIRKWILPSELPEEAAPDNPLTLAQ